MPLPPAIRDRARQLLLLSLGDSPEGERNNARSALERLLKSNGMDMHDLAEMLVAEPQPPAVVQPDQPPAGPVLRPIPGGGFAISSGDFIALIDTLRANAPLNAWEREFLTSHEERCGEYAVVRLSEKQAAVIVKLMERL